MLNSFAAAVTCTTGFDGVERCTTSDVNSGGLLAFMAGMWVVFFAVYIFMVVVQWKIFVKAGKPGWASLIPIYSNVVLLQIVGKPDWWVILYLIPFANIVVSIIVALELAKSFGKSGVFGFFGLILFPIVGYPMLAFGDSQYKGPAGGTAPTTPAPPLDPTATAPPAQPTPQA